MCVQERLGALCTRRGASAWWDPWGEPGLGRGRPYPSARISSSPGVMETPGSGTEAAGTAQDLVAPCPAWPGSVGVSEGWRARGPGSCSQQRNADASPQTSTCTPGSAQSCLVCFS